MRMLSRRLIVLLLLTAGPLVPALACLRTADAMPCCREAARCDFGIGTAGCCRIAPAPAPGFPAGVHGPSRIANLSGGPAAPAFLTDFLTAEPVTTLLAVRSGYPPSHDLSAPLFLRNASILC